MPRAAQEQIDLSPGAAAVLSELDPKFAALVREIGTKIPVRYQRDLAIMLKVAGLRTKVVAAICGTSKALVSRTMTLYGLNAEGRCAVTVWQAEQFGLPVKGWKALGCVQTTMADKERVWSATSDVEFWQGMTCQQAAHEKRGRTRSETVRRRHKEKMDRESRRKWRILLHTRKAGVLVDEITEAERAGIRGWEEFWEFLRERVDERLQRERDDARRCWPCLTVPSSRPSASST